MDFDEFVEWMCEHDGAIKFSESMVSPSGSQGSYAHAVYMIPYQRYEVEISATAVVQSGTYTEHRVKAFPTWRQTDGIDVDALLEWGEAVVQQVEEIENEQEHS